MLRWTSMDKISRHSFLRMITRALLSMGGFLGLAGLGRFFSYLSDPGPPNEFELGTQEEFPPGSQVIRADIPAEIRKTPGGIVARSLTCTHLGCTVEMLGSDYVCPCHGSRYGSDGQVIQGPALAALKEFRVETRDDGMLVLYRD
jgi:Rieske Fe-S protein